MQKRKQTELKVNGNDINKLVASVIVGAVLGLGTLFYRQIVAVEEQVREAKAILRVEIRDAAQSIRELEARVRTMEIKRR